MIFSAKNSAVSQGPRKFYEYIPFSILTVVYLALFQGTLGKLVTDWGQDANFSHGYLVPVISGYMAWHKRNDWLGRESEPSNWGLAILLMGGLLHVAGNAAAELFTMRFSMVLTLWGLLLYMKGRKVSQSLFFPVLYLLFMIPIPAVLWNGIAFPMQLWASQITARVLEVIGIAVLREGNVLHLPTTTLEVVEACSGIRSLTSLLALSAAFAYFASLKKNIQGDSVSVRHSDRAHRQYPAVNDYRCH